MVALLQLKLINKTKINIMTNTDKNNFNATIGNTVLYAVITKSLPNKRCVLNNYIGTPLEARNIGKNYIQVKLKKYIDWFSVPIDCVSLL